MKNRLFNRNFLMIIIGQMVSIFGNSVLRFALPLYILDKTGSTGIFGTVLAVSSIPVILFSPIGGILADRINKRNMMVLLDSITAAVICVCCFLLGIDAVVIIIALMMVILSMIQSIYQPIVQASIPVVVIQDNLEKANGSVSFVNAFSSLMAPIAAGLLYGSFGIITIMITSGVCFALAALMEMFIKIKVVNQINYGNVGEMIKADLKESIRYIFKDRPVLLKVMILVAFINLFLTSMTVVGLPAMIKIKLGLSSQLYGTTQGIIAVGMIVGGIFTSVLGKKIQVNKTYILLILAVASLLPIGLAFTINLPTMATYWIISISCFFMMVTVTMFAITMNTFIQRETPKHLIGKVISYVLILTQCSLPIGQAFYGYVFEFGIDYISIIVFITTFLSSVFAIYSKILFGKITVRERDNKLNRQVMFT